MMRDYIRAPVLIIFVGWTLFSLSYLAPNLEVGLDQRLSMPDDSYVLDYFNAQASQLRVGAPFYIVVSSTDTNYLDYSNATIQASISATGGSKPDSLANQVFQQSRQNNSMISDVTLNNWIDDYTVRARSSLLIVLTAFCRRGPYKPIAVDCSRTTRKLSVPGLSTTVLNSAPNVI